MLQYRKEKTVDQITAEMRQVKCLVNEMAKNRDIILSGLATVVNSKIVKDNEGLNMVIKDLIDDLAYWQPFEDLIEKTTLQVK